MNSRCESTASVVVGWNWSPPMSWLIYSNRSPSYSTSCYYCDGSDAGSRSAAGDFAVDSAVRSENTDYHYCFVTVVAVVAERSAVVVGSCFGKDSVGIQT